MTSFAKETGELLIRLPDTQLIREARTVLERAAPLPLVHHSIRSFLLARAFGRKHGIECDDDDLLLAALFHDLGLCPEHRDPGLPFQVVGSRALRTFLADRGVAPERISPLVDAIDFHLQMLPRWSKGNAVGLLQVGTWMDLTGLRRWGLRGPARAIEETYPPGNIRTRFHALLWRSFGSVGACVGTIFPGRYRA